MIEKTGKFTINKIYLGDSLELTKEVDTNSIDLIITDPPFAIDFKSKKGNYNRTYSNVIEGYKEVSKTDYAEFTKQWIFQAYRILKNTGSIYIFSGWNNLKDILIALDDAGFITLNHLIWKYQFGVFTRRKYVTSHYHILYAVKDDKKYKFNKIEHYPEDVWIINREYWHYKKKTPTKLPTKLVEKILHYSSDKGDIIFDPFLGSGTVAVVSKAMGRKYLGFEIVKDYFDFAKERLAPDLLSQKEK